jgi:RES domain-containing protein
LPDPALLGRIDGLPQTPFAGVAFRHQPPQYAPLSGRGARIQGGRWNPRDSFSVLYLGLDEQVVAGEFRRLVARQSRTVADFLPRTLYRYELELNRLLDLRTAEALAAVGLSLADVQSDDLTACQRVGEAAHHGGREGVLAASATGGGEILALFVDRLGAGSSIVPKELGEWKVPRDAPS